MIRLCGKDVFRNRLFFLILLIFNMGYVAIHFLPKGQFNSLCIEFQELYIMVIAVLIPSFMNQRYSDVNRNIVQETIGAKVRNLDLFQICYQVLIIHAILAVTLVTLVILSFLPNFSLFQEILFACHIYIISILFVLLFIGLVNIINRFILGSVIYLVSVFVLVLINAPYSYLWLKYSMEYDLTDGTHWIGKGLFLFLFFIIYSMSFSIKRVRERGK
ncbi:hypothetical protein LJC58_06545 [Lachnospiraceae bacterium OttesenSCG-928-D06]|nr:hypothetical protein [Lachnospiraceae bacterium OttesenSCG-928-D06]